MWRIRRDLRDLTMAPTSYLVDLAAAGGHGTRPEKTWLLRGVRDVARRRRASSWPVGQFTSISLGRCGCSDSFEGLPPPKEIDGPAANAWAADTSSPGYFDNCRASLEEVQDAAEKLGLSSSVKLVKGWFNETIAAKKSEVAPIAVLSDRPRTGTNRCFYA